MTDYLTTLAGPPPQGEAAQAFYARVAEVSGLPLDAVTQARGFVTGAYVKSLRASDDKIVSRYDATFAVDDPFPEERAGHAPDPILDGITRAYGGAFAAYARNELGFKTEMTYQLLGRRRHARLGLGGRTRQTSASKATCACCCRSRRRSAC